MNKIINNNLNLMKKTIITIVILLLCNFVMPMYTYALQEPGKLNTIIVPIFLMIPDLLLNKLQNIFIGYNVEFRDPDTGALMSIEINENGDSGEIIGTIEYDEEGNKKINYNKAGTDVEVSKLDEYITKTQIDIAQKDPKGGVSSYLIMYSPAVIFSGKVAGLDVNFISPMGINNEGKVYKNWIEYSYTKLEDEIDYEAKDVGDKDLRDYGLDLEKATVRNK